MKQEKEFDRSHCFTFYNDFHEQIMDVKRDFGLEQAFDVYEAIVNYGLYGTEIEKGRIRTLVGNATISKVENSQANRARWFNGENFEQTKVVAEYMRDHPEASQRTIAAATGVGKTKVGKVQKNMRETGLEPQEYLDYIVYPNLNNTNSDNNNYNNSYNNNNSNNNIVGETETDQRDQSVQSFPQTKSFVRIEDESSLLTSDDEKLLKRQNNYNFKSKLHFLTNEKIKNDIDNIIDDMKQKGKSYEKIIESVKELANSDDYQCDIGTVTTYVNSKLINRK